MSRAFSKPVLGDELTKHDSFLHNFEARAGGVDGDVEGRKRGGRGGMAIVSLLSS